MIRELNPHLLRHQIKNIYIKSITYDFFKFFAPTFAPTKLEFMEDLCPARARARIHFLMRAVIAFIPSTWTIASR